MAETTSTDAKTTSKRGDGADKKRRAAVRKDVATKKAAKRAKLAEQRMAATFKKLERATKEMRGAHKHSTRSYSTGLPARRHYIKPEERSGLWDMVQVPLTQQDKLAREGLPISFVSAFQSDLGIGVEQTAEILQVSVRTLQRNQSQGKDLDASQSGRLLRAAQITARARKLLGDTEAIEWLRREQAALNYRVPIDLLETEPGARAVEQLLGRIDYGVYT